MTELHPALAFLRDRIPAACVLGAEALAFEVDGVRIEIFTASAGAAALFAAGSTRLSYRSSAPIPESSKESLRRMLLELREALSAGRVESARDALADGGGWTDSGADPTVWRDWVVRSYRGIVASGRRDACAGLPDCLDLRMRPPIAAPWPEIAAAPRSGPCSRCGRAGGCVAARQREDVYKPLRHADAASAELAALQVLAQAASLPLEKALAAYQNLNSACGDRALEGSLPLEYSVRMPRGEQQPDRLRFVSYYPLVSSDAVREQIHRRRREAVRELAALWLTPAEATALDAWLDCAAATQPATLGLSIGVEMDATDIRLQVYAHPEADADGERFAAAAVTRLGGAAGDVSIPSQPPVLIGIALSANRPPALKLYYHRTWAERGDTGLLSDGLAELEPFNPGWGLAINEQCGGRAAWVKWDFPVTTHYQDYERFLSAFWRATGAPQLAVPDWLSGEQFSPWPTWASLGRGGWALYFHAR